MSEEEPKPTTETVVPTNINTVKYARLRHLAKGMASIRDPTLASIGYSSLFVSSLTNSPKLKNLYSMISDFRMFTRMWDTAGLMEWGIDTVDNAHKSSSDFLDESLVKLEAYSAVLYQVLENIAYLSSKGVIKISSKLETKIWIYSCVMWALYVQIELIRLVRQALASKGTKIPYKQLFVNLAWLPLTLHWSTTTGFLSSGAVGILGAAASLPGAITAWKNLS